MGGPGLVAAKARISGVTGLRRRHPSVVWRRRNPPSWRYLLKTHSVGALFVSDAPGGGAANFHARAPNGGGHNPSRFGRRGLTFKMKMGDGARFMSREVPARRGQISIPLVSLDAKRVKAAI